MRAGRFAGSVFICGLAVAGCASTGGGTDQITPAASAEAYQSELRSRIETELSEAAGDEGEKTAQLLVSKPYYYKQYWEYPVTAPVFSTDFTEKESLSVPMTAEVQVEKTRFATRATRSKADARADESYLRSSGIEQGSYELRHGQWRRVGSLFLAQRTEEFRDGQWIQVEEQKQVVAIEEEEPGGFWQRLMFWR